MCEHPWFRQKQSKSKQSERLVGRGEAGGEDPPGAQERSKATPIESSPSSLAASFSLWPLTRPQPEAAAGGASIQGIRCAATGARRRPGLGSFACACTPRAGRPFACCNPSPRPCPSLPAPRYSYFSKGAPTDAGVLLLLLLLDRPDRTWVGRVRVLGRPSSNTPRHAHCDVQCAAVIIIFCKTPHHTSTYAAERMQKRTARTASVEWKGGMCCVSCDFCRISLSIPLASDSFALLSFVWWNGSRSSSTSHGS